MDAWPGPLVIQFGAGWCGHCIAAQPLIGSAFADHPGVAHVRIEDGPGRPLGRSYRIKLWPTLVFLRDGVELARLVRPSSVDAITRALVVIDTAAPRTSGSDPA